MHKTPFSRPVDVTVGITGEVFHLLSADQAIELLSRHWRTGGSLKQKSALRACLQAVSGEISPDMARHEVVQAAREANMLVE